MHRIRRAEVAMEKFEQIDKANQNRDKRPLSFKKKHYSRWSPGVCRECGKYFEMITQDHARKHGYQNADDMAKHGQIDWR